MGQKTWPIFSILACFACLVGFLVLNDVNYRQEAAYRDVQIKTFAAYSDWNIFIGTLRGSLLTSSGLGPTLDEASALKTKVSSIIDELKVQSAPMDPEVTKAVDSFIDSITAGLALGQEIIDNGRLLLRQPDLPRAYSEGRLGLANLTGKDAVTQMGQSAAYQYYQLIRRLKGMNSLFDQLYSDRLESILSKVSDSAGKVQAQFVILRIAFLLVLVLVVAFTVIRLAGLNRSLRRLADKTSLELDSARTSLNEVQGFLHNARFQRSLFEMVAGISHELNTPLGNCVTLSSYLEIRLSGYLSQGEALSPSERETGITDTLEGLRMIRRNLDQMRFQIETFKQLSNVNQETLGPAITLSEYVGREVPRLAGQECPDLRVSVDWDGRDLTLRYDALEQILGQLFRNSADHADARKVSLAFTVEDEFLVIRYRDDGQGVSEEMLSRLAEPFFTTARGKNHMGLGLSIVASLVANKLQGTIGFGRGGPGLTVTVHARLRNLGFTSPRTSPPSTPLAAGPPPAEG